MALTVIVRSGELEKPARITFDAPRIVIGRGDGCEVLLPDPSVSHRHASIRQRGTDYVVLDEGSTNGTFVGPVRLSPQAPRVLRSGDLLRIGRIWLEVRIEQVPVTQSQKLLTREIALALVANALDGSGDFAGARLTARKGPAAGAELVLASGRVYVIGRGAGVDLSLDDPDLSRRHVEVLRRGVTIVVRDLGSKNGTELDGERLESGKEITWVSGTPLMIGQTELVFEDPVAQALAELEGVPDERMRDEDSVDPPTSNPSSVAPAPSKPPRAPAPDAAAPIAEVPPRQSDRRATPGLRTLDLVVGLVAVAVLTLSLLGLWLLFQT